MLTGRSKIRNKFRKVLIWLLNKRGLIIFFWNVTQYRVDLKTDNLCTAISLKIYMVLHPKGPKLFIHSRENVSSHIFSVFGREDSGQEEIWNLKTSPRMEKITGGGSS